jgi:hypothetical protein
MNKFYFKHRNIGLDPDTNKYYLSSIEELINQVESLKTTKKMNHIQWSISPTNNEKMFYLMTEYWTIEKRGTDIPLKCMGWFVCGYIFTDETNGNIYDLLPEWNADYTNRFIERRYMTVNDFNKLSDDEKEKCIKDDGFILNKNLDL